MENFEETETDAPAAKGAVVQTAAGFRTIDTTMNVMQSDHGMLVPLTDSGLHYFLAGARANIGMKSGRYLFQVKIIENITPTEEPLAKQRVSRPQSQLRVGFSCGGSNLFLGEGEENVCFDSEGGFTHNRERQTVSPALEAGSVLAVLLNLQFDSENVNTMSLFVDGRRACRPQKLPDSLHGKTLFPTLTFKNMTLQYNFGAPLVPLPFVCRGIGEALKKDVAVVPASVAAKDGKNTVLFPVFLPDEGTFDWLDLFLEEHPQYVELSDRAIVDWAEKSGIVRPGNKDFSQRTSNDKPELGVGLPSLDDGSILRMLQEVAPLQQRDYVHMEVKGNLLQEDREKAMARWSGFKRVATVMCGAPPASFQQHCQGVNLKLKQEASDAEFKTKQAEALKNRQSEKVKKRLEKERAKKVKEQQRKAAEVKRKIEAAKKKREAEAKGEEYVEEEAPMEEEEAEEPEEEAPMDEEPPKVELSPEEMKLPFAKRSIPDLASFALSTSFAKFSLPSKSEGFDEVKFDWQNADKCRETLKHWVQEKKNTTRIEDIKPGEYFTAQYKLWQNALKAWHQKMNTHRVAVGKKANEKKVREIKRNLQRTRVEKAKEAHAQKVEALSVKKAAAIKENSDAEAAKAAKSAGKATKTAAREAKAAERKAAKEAAKKEAEEKGEEVPKEEEAAAEPEDEDDAEENMMEARADQMRQAEEARVAEAEEMLEDESKKMQQEEQAQEKSWAEEDEAADGKKVNFDKLDVFGVEDITDLGNGQPLFSAFTPEDWALMSLRYEITLLCRSFQRDANDADRAGMHVEHLPFYYSKYFKKALNPKFWGVETVPQIVELVKDTVIVTRRGKVVEPQLPEDMESIGVFVMLTEEARRHRVCRVDLGDESAKLKIQIQAVGLGAVPAASSTTPVVQPASAGVAPGQAALIRPHMMGGVLPQRPVAPRAVTAIRPGFGGLRPGMAMIRPLLGR